MKKISNILLYILLLFGVYASSSLSSNQILSGNICTNIGFVPACYIMLGSFVCLLLAHSSHLKNIFFYTITLLPITISIIEANYFINQSIEATRNIGGFPAYFVSLGILITIVILKHISSQR